MPAFAAAIASWLARPIRAAALETSTTDPPSVFMSLPAARTQPKAESRLAESVPRHSAVVVRCAGLSRSEPQLVA